ncbi:hypothetical protein PIB30_104408 [Stylosanthes scabra]|uniref:Uncharacterized protein n=1 Tax=Stylosanthes scabra TaxID=79078 RepID=A0ABU6VWP7_9FABA|nr:hypothetical protein [Stylosanthes scabra]
MDRIRSTVKSAIRFANCGSDPIRNDGGSDSGFPPLSTQILTLTNHYSLTTNTSTHKHRPHPSPPQTPSPSLFLRDSAGAITHQPSTFSRLHLRFVESTRERETSSLLKEDLAASSLLEDLRRLVPLVTTAVSRVARRRR